MLATALLLAAGGTARAQDQPLEKPPPPLERALRFGLVQVRPSFRIQDLGYDSDVLTGGPGGDRGDLTARVVADVLVQVPLGRRAFLSFEERPAYGLFLHTPSQNYPANLLSARGDAFFRDFTLFAGASRDSAEERSGNETDRRIRIEAGLIEAGAMWRPGGRFSVSAVAASRHALYSQRTYFMPVAESQSECSTRLSTHRGSVSIGELLDRREQSLDLRASYRAFARSRAFVEVSNSSTAFDSCPGRDSRRWSWMPGMLLDPTAALSGSIEAGPAIVDPDDPTRSGFRGILGKAELGWRPIEGWKIGAHGERAVDFSIEPSNLFSVATGGGGSITRALGSRASLELGGESTRVSWPQPFCLAAPSYPRTCTALQVRHDHIGKVFIGAALRLAGRTNFSIRLSYQRRRSNAPGNENSVITLLTGSGT